jgi:transketolase C-terminal domain/subunit
MRRTLANHINEDGYLIHADMFNVNRFPTRAQVVDVGLGESNALNIAAGISSQGRTVYVYGVAGFIIHHIQQLKLNAKHFAGGKGVIIICNAGKVGYEKMGIGHSVEGDEEIMGMLGIPFYSPNDSEDLVWILNSITENGVYYIQLGGDE